MSTAKHSDPPQLPKFQSDEEAAAFWETHDLDEYLDQMPVKEMHVSAKPKQNPVGIRLDASLLERVRAIAKRRAIPYQTLMRSWIIERVIAEERRKK